MKADRTKIQELSNPEKSFRKDSFTEVKRQSPVELNDLVRLERVREEILAVKSEMKMEKNREYKNDDKGDGKRKGRGSPRRSSSREPHRPDSRSHAKPGIGLV